jgi:choice-of-anchor B domain-containing protein
VRSPLRRLLHALAAISICGAPAFAHDTEPGDGGIPGDESESFTACVGGLAGTYPCLNTDLASRVTPASMGGSGANDIWGWRDPVTGTEYAIVGLREGTAFVDLSDPHHPVVAGMLPSNTTDSVWRDARTWQDHAYLVSEAPGHGLQVFDLTTLRTAPPGTTFAATSTYLGFGDAHNISIDLDTGYAYVQGSNTCSGGPHMLDLVNPAAPVFVGCVSQDGYSHDGQCVVYHGPDSAYAGREICFQSNEDTLTIFDVTVKATPVLVSRSTYVGSGYSHQGWPTDDHRWFLLGDELDELDFGHGTRTWIWDVSDLDSPVLQGFDEQGTSIDHNLFVQGEHVFQAHYTSGMRVLRMGDLAQLELGQVASFDTWPADDGLTFNGAWGVYPFLPSGHVLVSDQARGLFVLTPDLAAVRRCDDDLDNDGDGLRDWDGDGGAPDPHCANPSDHTEKFVAPPVACGLGPEIAGALLLLAGLRRRGRAGSAS